MNSLLCRFKRWCKYIKMIWQWRTWDCSSQTVQKHWGIVSLCTFCVVFSESSQQDIFGKVTADFHHIPHPITVVHEQEGIPNHSYNIITSWNKSSKLRFLEAMLVAKYCFESAAMNTSKQNTVSLEISSLFELSDLVCWTWPQHSSISGLPSLKQLAQALKEGTEPLIVSWLLSLSRWLMNTEQVLLSTKSRHVYSCLKKHPEHGGSFKLLKDLTLKQETIQEVGIYR